MGLRELPAITPSVSSNTLCDISPLTGRRGKKHPDRNACGLNLFGKVRKLWASYSPRGVVCPSTHIITSSLCGCQLDQKDVLEKVQVLRSA